MQKTNAASPPIRYKGIGLKKGMKKYWMLYVMMILPLAQYIIFRYCPLWGIQVAFKDYNLFKGIAGSKWEASSISTKPSPHSSSGTL